MIKLKDLLIEKVSTIPTVLYHGTFNQLIPSIYEKGLIPHGTTVINFSGTERGVYLTNNKEEAVAMVQASENAKIPEQWFDEIVVISIDTSKLDRSKLFPDPNVNVSDPFDLLWLIYKDVVPPSALINVEDGD